MSVHSIDSVAQAAIALGVIVVAGKLAGEMAVRLIQPAVIGEAARSACF